MFPVRMSLPVSWVLRFRFMPQGFGACRVPVLLVFWVSDIIRAVRIGDAGRVPPHPPSLGIQSYSSVG